MVVYIKDAGGVRKVRIPDPRKAFCEEFNRTAAQYGMIATLTPPQPAAPDRSAVGRKSVQRPA
jgi:hypothetical protein